MIFVYAFIGIIIFIVLALLGFNLGFNHIFKKRADVKSQDIPFSIYDFPHLKKERIHIINSKKKQLNGAIFSNPKKKADAVIIFYHGVFSGYNSYLAVINYLVSKNYIVVAFDFMGCMSSEGLVLGMPYADIDAKEIINFVINNDRLNKYPIYTLGHSMGGHAALTSLLFDDSNIIKKAAALSPFNSNIDVMFTFNPLIKLLAPLFYLLYLFKFGTGFTYKAVDAFKYSHAKILVLQGDKDKIVDPKYSFNKFKKIKNDNATLHLYANRKHFLYLDARGEEAITNKLGKVIAQDDLVSFNNSYLFKLDEKVLNEITDFFKN